MSTNKPFIGGNFPQEIADAIEDCFYANRFKSKAQVIEMILRSDRRSAHQKRNSE